MADIKSPEERSRNMRAIHNKDTRPEVYLRKLLFSRGLRYRKNVPQIPGHPDMYLAKYRTAIFVHGCFWHHHKGCKYAYMPKTRQDFWQHKFEANVMRDVAVRSEIAASGIRQITIWECTIRNMRKDTDMERKIVSDLLAFLEGPTDSMEV